MENFIAYNPTQVHFGRNCIKTLGTTTKELGKRVLLLCGKGSIRKNGIYEKVIAQLKTDEIQIFEYSGIKSNPLVDNAREAAKIGIDNKIDVIVAVGGGSVIDSAKIISLAIANNIDPWDIMKYKSVPKSNIPLIAILTIAATGSEMNGAAVLQNHETKEKIAYVSPLNYPKHSYLDPEFTFSVPKKYTAYGIVDLIAHSLESYFGEGKASLADRFVESIIKEAIENAPLVLNDPQNYNYRANIMWAATMALNGTNDYGRKNGDWGVHDIAHNISFLYDTPHGATLSIVYPAWLKLLSTRIPDRIKQLGKQLFNVNSVDETIDSLEKFFISVDCPVRLSDIDIYKDKQNEITQQILNSQANGMFHKLSDEDKEKLVKLMM
ncbi:MAG: iron-containing alcohol dehydrogenase [Bacteroidales bacterium]|nr:iron-containing alcohol dehydrogenase [Bacteroidales bacterium]